MCFMPGWRGHSEGLLKEIKPKVRNLVAQELEKGKTRATSLIARPT